MEDIVGVVFWVVVGALAFVGEMLTVSFFLLFFAVGAVFALVLALLGFGVAVQLGGFVAASLLSVLALRPVLTRGVLAKGGERYEPADRVVGKSGVVTSEIEPGGSGAVRVGRGEFWTARAMYASGGIKTGTRVRVLGTDGLVALVEAIEVKGGEG